MTTTPVCIIIPCYNEAERLPAAAFLTYQQSHADVSFCFVNDGSRDKTADVLARLQQQNPAQIDVLNLTQNQGKAGAVRAGMLHAVQQGHTYLGYFDADLATPLTAIDDLRLVLDKHPDCVFVMGSRIKHLGVNIERNAFRHYVGRVIATIISLILKLPVYDTQCGAKLLHSSIVSTVFHDAFISPWLFDVELLARLIGHFGRPNLPGKLLEEPLQEWIEQADSRLSPTYIFACGLSFTEFTEHTVTCDERPFIYANQPISFSAVSASAGAYWPAYLRDSCLCRECTLV